MQHIFYSETFQGLREKKTISRRKLLQRNNRLKRRTLFSKTLCGTPILGQTLTDRTWVLAEACVTFGNVQYLWSSCMNSIVLSRFVWQLHVRYMKSWRMTSTDSARKSRKRKKNDEIQGNLKTDYYVSLPCMTYSISHESLKRILPVIIQEHLSAPGLISEEVCKQPPNVTKPMAKGLPTLHGQTV